MQVNVRSGPGTTYESLGLLDAGTVIQVTLASEEGLWYRILYPAGEDGFGWVSAAFVTFPAGTPDFSALNENSIPPGAFAGRILQRLNVRSGPGTSFDTLATLETGSTVFLTAKNPTASWFQIIHPPGSTQRGWVTAQYVQTDSAASLPVVDEFGNPVSTGTPGPSPVPMTPTPTLGPAIEDGDSPSNPAVRILFSSGGTQRFTYSSQVSAPSGDLEDWVEFTPFSSLPGNNARLLLSLTCGGQGTLFVELWAAEAPVSNWGTLACGEVNQEVSLAPGNPYQVRLSIAEGTDLRLIHYSLTVQNLP